MSASPFVFALIWTPAAFRSISCAAEATPASASADATTTAASRPRITLIHIGRRAAPHAPSNRGTLQLANETDALARAARAARDARRRTGRHRLRPGRPQRVERPARRVRRREARAHHLPRAGPDAPRSRVGRRERSLTQPGSPPGAVPVRLDGWLGVHRPHDLAELLPHVRA